MEEGGATCGGYPGALPRLAGGELLVLCEAAVLGVEGGAVTLGWGRHARVHGHSAPCPNIPPRWPFLVCGRGWPRALARASSLLRGRGGGRELLSAGA